MYCKCYFLNTLVTFAIILWYRPRLKRACVPVGSWDTLQIVITPLGVETPFNEYLNMCKYVEVWSEREMKDTVTDTSVGTPLLCFHWFFPPRGTTHVNICVVPGRLGTTLRMQALNWHRQHSTHIAWSRCLLHANTVQVHDNTSEKHCKYNTLHHKGTNKEKA